MSGGKEKLSLRHRLHLQLRNIPSTFITWHGQVPIKIMDGKVNAERYMDFLEELLWSIMSNFSLMVTLFSKEAMCLFTTPEYRKLSFSFSQTLASSWYFPFF